MHPDDAVELAMRDLRALTRPAFVPAARDRDRGMRAAWRRYMDGWRWYAASELALPEPGAGAPVERCASPRAPAKAPLRFRCTHPRFELLFGRPAAGYR
jgi:hypothetical protein